jgi:hypothetical protein
MKKHTHTIKHGLNTSVLFLNHASILIKKGDGYLLTDPWHQRPSFGSWLPTFTQYIHPTYIAALGKKLSILISHGHDDHCDDDLLSIFDKDIEIITADFNAPSVLNRLKKLGFTNIKTANREGLKITNGFTIKSYINPVRSLDDATYTIDTDNGFVVHCNDNWFEFDDDTFKKINIDICKYSPKNVAFFSQTNSASGYPLNYKNFTEEEKVSILKLKVKGMVVQGMKNALKLGLNSFYSYAGLASIFIKDKPEYLALGIIPTGKYIRDYLLDDDESKRLSSVMNIKDFYPGDTLNLDNGEITNAFISNVDYTDTQLKDATLSYYEKYGIKNQCGNYKEYPVESFDQKQFLYFLKNLNEFAERKVKSDGIAFETIIGKIFEIKVEDINVVGYVKFGEDARLEKSLKQPNKRMTVKSAIFNEVLNGNILFENLYTGYGAEWERFPKNEYNRDIVMFIVMFSYIYKNRLSALYFSKKEPKST